MRYLIFFSTLFFLTIISCNGQNDEKSTEQKAEQKNLKYNPKDLKILAEFIDTALLDRFYPEIQKFNEKDSLFPHRKIDVVFAGSSSVRKWETLEKDMNSLMVLNRGFGGSTVPEAIFYADILFLKHKPKKIVFYSGDNDVASLKSSTEKIIKSYKFLYNLLDLELPDTQIFFLSIKPSPARWQFWPQMKKITSLLKKFCNKKSNCHFIDVSSSMVDSSGNLRKGLFVKDRIHLNEEGYKLWADIIFPEIRD